MGIEDKVKELEIKNANLKNRNIELEEEVDFHKWSVSNLKSYKSMSNILMGAVGVWFLYDTVNELTKLSANIDISKGEYVLTLFFPTAICGMIGGYFIGRHLDNRQYTYKPKPTPSLNSANVSE